MTELKCTCKTKDCPTKINLSNAGELWITDKEGKETLMYIDANTIVEMIKYLKDNLIKLTEKEL